MIHARSTWKSGALVRAVFNDAMTHRYLLTHEVRGLFLKRANFVLWLLVNPSTATHEVSDPTLTRCAGFTARFGFDEFRVCNLFSVRSTSPKILATDTNAEGDPENLKFILETARDASLVICGWGVNGAMRGRADAILGALRAIGVGDKLRCLGVTQAGAPLHPLYRPGNAELLPFVSHA